MVSPAAKRISTPQLHLLASFFFLFLLLLDRHEAVVAAASSPAVSFSFDFSNIPADSLADLRCQGDATFSRANGLVNLTTSSVGGRGRMSYAHPVQLYDNTSGRHEVASFSTNFTFAIVPLKDMCRGDGMAFFLAYYPSSEPPENSNGGNLGLIAGEEVTGKTIATGKDSFVAVEFGTYNDDGNNSDRIRIGINTVRETIYSTSLPDNTRLEGNMTAYVVFNSSTRTLHASLVLQNHPSADPVQVKAPLPDPVTLLPPQVAVGFSAATGSCVELHQIMSWSFNSTLALVKDRNKIAGLLAGLIIAGVVALVLVVWLLLSCWKWKRVLKAFHKGTAGARRFEYRDLASATDNFSDDHKLGEGAFGVVYRGSLKQLDREVAVKKIVKELHVGHKDFFSEVITISEAKHKNLVKFFGWCIRGHSWNILHFMCGCCWNMENKELFLVYELMKNGNLHEYLHESEVAAVQSWPTRYKIAKDIGSALFYLHHDCKPYILHRDIKPGNILLDENFNAKLADFGLSRMANPDNNAMMQTTVVGSAEEHVDVQTTAVGSEGYIDPQCKKDGNVRFNCPSDVYSLGIVLLEIACTDKSREQIWDLYRSGGDVVEAADTKLAIGGNDAERREMERVIILGLWCSAWETKHRPTMLQAMDVLERDAPLPDLNLIVNSNLASTDQDASSASVANSYEEVPDG